MNSMKQGLPPTLELQSQFSKTTKEIPISSHKRRKRFLPNLDLQTSSMHTFSGEKAEPEGILSIKHNSQASLQSTQKQKHQD